MAYRHCPRCGGEFQAWVQRCLDCDVVLHDPVAADCIRPIAPRTREQPDADRRTTSLDIGHLSPAERQRLQMLLPGHDMRFEMTGERVWFPAIRLAEVEALLDDLGASSGEGDGRRVCRRTPVESATRADRKVVRPRIEADQVRASRRAGAWRRGIARIIDGWVMTAVFALHDFVLEPIPYASWIFIVALFASFESLWGRTPGKAVIGIRVEDGAGNRPTPRAAMIRNAWQLFALVPVIGPWSGVVVQIGIGWLIHREPACRGPHDWLAGTHVVRSRVRRAVDVGAEGFEPPTSSL